MSRRVLCGALVYGSLALAGHAADLQKAPTEPAPIPAAPSFFLFSDTQVAYTFADNTKEPGIPATRGNPFDGRGVPKNSLTISHANAWEYGTNFVAIDIIRSGSQDPSGFALPFQGIATGVGATEAFGVYRGTLSGNALTKSKAFVIPGIIKDVSLAYGTDLDTKNTSFGAEERRVVAGLTFSFDIPVGFFNLSTLMSKEFNRNGLVPLPARAVEFDYTAAFEATYNIPLAFTGLPLSLAGFSNVVLPKGINGFGQRTATEFISRTNLVLDLGKLVYDQPNKVDVFVGFQYWINKFGNDHRLVPGSEEKSFRAGVAYHIF